MKQRDYLWCLLHAQLDREEELEGMCPSCRSKALEPRCACCGQPMTVWGEGTVNAAFDLARFEQLKGAGA